LFDKNDLCENVNLLRILIYGAKFMKQHSEFPFLTIKKVAQILDVHVDTVYNLIHSGRLHARKLTENGDYRVRSADFDTYIASVFDSPAAVTASVKSPKSDATLANRRHAGAKQSFFELGRQQAATKRQRYVELGTR
jgi:excisionase family DNA binding protein